MTRIAVTRLEPVERGAAVAEGAKAWSLESGNSPDRIHKLLAPLLADSPVEVFVALGLDVRHRAVAHWIVSQGQLSGCQVHPREVFGNAMRLGTVAALVVAHNHPSGDPSPSAEDIAVTRRLIEAGTLLGVPVLDHIVVAGDQYQSLRSLGLWPTT